MSISDKVKNKKKPAISSGIDALEANNERLQERIDANIAKIKICNDKIDELDQD